MALAFETQKVWKKCVLDLVINLNQSFQSRHECCLGSCPVWHLIKLIEVVLKGEFFDLAKLLNKNLLKLQNLNDEFMDTSQGLELFIGPDNRMLKAKAPKRLSITTLDEWTKTHSERISP